MNWKLPTFTLQQQPHQNGWDDPLVRLRRSTKERVEVDGVLYKSVECAFLHLGLPRGRVRPFRLLLKRKRTLTAYGRTWIIRPYDPS